MAYKTLYGVVLLCGTPQLLELSLLVTPFQAHLPPGGSSDAQGCSYFRASVAPFCHF